jgi:hypothetical protein
MALCEPPWPNFNYQHREVILQPVGVANQESTLIAQIGGGGRLRTTVREWLGLLRELNALGGVVQGGINLAASIV